MAVQPKNDLADAGDLLRFFSEKRSVRNFTSDPVDPRAIELMIRAAITAPFWGKAPCWHMIVVDDPKVLGKLERAATSGLKKLNFWVRTVPTIIVCCARPGLSKVRQGIPYYAVDAAIALERASLMAHQLGLGSCWLGSFDERTVRRSCRIPSTYRVVALLAVGHEQVEGDKILGVPIIEDFGQYYDLARSKFERQKRFSLKEAVSYNTLT